MTKYRGQHDKPLTVVIALHLWTIQQNVIMRAYAKLEGAGLPRNGKMTRQAGTSRRAAPAVRHGEEKMVQSKSFGLCCRRVLESITLQLALAGHHP
jgi:hypothetical protein